MWTRKNSLLLPLFCASMVHAQFAPPAGQAGSSAIHKDSAILVSWAVKCEVVRGLQDITNSTLGTASVGHASLATGKAGDNGVVSLGDGGSAVLTFAEPIRNGVSWDFAVFENAITDSFLELAFVEVSSDGLNFFRFPATSMTQDTLQIASFGAIEATAINNLAGKYRSQYGTPFDLEAMQGIPGLNVDAITHVKVIDVVGCIQDEHTSHDQHGHKVNEPWPTPFPSGGFDLDAVGVIGHVTSVGESALQHDLSLFPNPANGRITLVSKAGIPEHAMSLSDAWGREVMKWESSCNTHTTDISAMPPGIYQLTVRSANTLQVIKLIIAHD